MKTLLLSLLLSLSVFASQIYDIENSYNTLNGEIDKISSDLSAEEKLLLYYLVLSTHEKITTALSLDECARLMEFSVHKRLRFQQLAKLGS